MPIMNETLCGHIVFTTTVAAAAPTPAAGAYNATVARDGGNAGAYIVRVGAALAPPGTADMDAAISNSLTAAGGWASAVLGPPTVDATTGDRFYPVAVFEAPAGAVIVSNTAGVVVRLTLKRVEPRTS